MLKLGSKKKYSADAVLDSLSNSMAIIEFEPTGVILRANENFCAAVGYEEAEIVGKHHRIFCDKDYTSSQEYTEFRKDYHRVPSTPVNTIASQKTDQKFGSKRPIIQF